MPRPNLKEFSLPKKLEGIFLETHFFTEKKLKKLKRSIANKLPLAKYKNICIIAVGSYGRYEASKESDLDVYMFSESEVSKKKEEKINNVISEIAKASDVKFSTGFNSITQKEMVTNIGGENDTNLSITNRILFLLESECIYNKRLFHKTYKRVLDKYLSDIRLNCKLPRFLLNDIIRYYRTICVDYEFKTTEQGKEWAIRNIKLRFSRKALFIGGVLILLNSSNVKRDCYKYILLNLRTPFTSKLSSVIKLQPKIKKNCEKIIIIYSEFLREISSAEIRQHLKTVTKSNKEEDEVYCSLSSRAKDFNAAIWKMLNKGEWGNKKLDCLVL